MGLPGMTFGGGFASGIASALANKRQRDEQDKSRQVANLWKGIGFLVDSGQVSDIADLQPQFDALSQLGAFGDPKAQKKGQPGPQDHVTNILGHIIRQGNGQPQGGAPSANPTVNAMPLPGSVRPDVTGPDDAGQVMPFNALPSQAIQPPPAAPQRRTLMGIPLMTPDERIQREMQQRQSAQTSELEGQIALARRMLPALQAVDPAITMRDALAYAANRQFPTRQAAEAPGLMTVAPGGTVIDKATGEVKYQAPERPAREGVETVTVAPGGSVVNRKTGEVVYKAPDRPEKAGAATADDTALAEMAADNPAMLQGLTPTVAGSVMRGIAANPALKARYEEVRMQPIRDKASAVISTLDQLLDVDANGKTSLKPGAAGLYGMHMGQVARHIPGTEAATAAAALDQITGQLTIDALGAMKEQSRTGATGFGSLSARELDVIQRAATILKGKISPEQALKELTTIRDRFSKVLQPAKTGAGATTAKKDANGNWILSLP